MNLMQQPGIMSLWRRVIIKGGLNNKSWGRRAAAAMTPIQSNRPTEPRLIMELNSSNSRRSNCASHFLALIALLVAVAIVVVIAAAAADFDPD